jgi:hypothetical protein
MAVPITSSVMVAAMMQRGPMDITILPTCLYAWTVCAAESWRQRRERFGSPLGYHGRNALVRIVSVLEQGAKFRRQTDLDRLRWLVPSRRNELEHFRT